MDKYLDFRLTDPCNRKKLLSAHMSHSPKPEASSHMFWFFILPCLGFMIWASFKLVGGLTHKAPKQDLFSKVEKIKGGKSPGDRWQAAYAVSQELQGMIQRQEFVTMDSQLKLRLFKELSDLLEAKTTDDRMKKYLLLTMGQMGDVALINSIEKHLQDASPEVKFFSSWAFVEILSKHKQEITQQRIDTIRTWLNSDDPALQKISTSFLVQVGQNGLRDEVAVLLKNENYEVRWNAAVALASVKDSRAESILLEMFDMQYLKKLNLKTTKDLEQLLATGSTAAVHLESAKLRSAAEKLKATSNPQSPEGHAIAKGLAPLLQLR
jgi:hypothetical protein